MKWFLVVPVLAVVALAGCTTYEDSGFLENARERACTNSGGTITTQLCCQSANDFPNTCLIGACGCAPTNSKEVKFCDCGEGKCWNGTSCAAS